MNLVYLRRTADDKLSGTIRILLGILFLMTGAMKLTVPTLAEAWSGQLIAAELPFYTLSRWSVPFVEMAVGALLLVARMCGWLEPLSSGLWWWRRTYTSSLMVLHFFRCSPASRSSRSRSFFWLPTFYGGAVELGAEI